MKTTTLALILVALAVLAPVTYVLAVSNGNIHSSYSFSYGMMGGTSDGTGANNMITNGESIEDQDWWDEMIQYMEDHVNQLDETTEQGTKDFEDWWDQMADSMEDHFGELSDEEWFSEMRAYMENHWSEIKDQGWFNDVREHMEDHMSHFNESWWDEMEHHMEEHWEELEEEGIYGHGCH